MKAIVWTRSAQADVRRLDRETAMRVLHALHRFAQSGEGDVRKLQDEGGELRLRIGDYRLRFTEDPQGTLVVHTVRHRSQAYSRL